MNFAAILAVNRFGLGRRPDDALPADPRTWLHSQLNAPDPTPLQKLPDTAAALAVALEQIGIQQARKQAVAQAMRNGGAAAAADTTTAKPDASKPGAGMPGPVADLAHREMRAYLGNALTTPAPFRERLVWFWANHFTIAAHGLVPAACCGTFVREAIRPYVTGRFADMLMAVMRHPAMLAYLNQEQSAGANSMAGRRRHIGLNENLARECLELHTVSPAAGYTQADVTNFARVLTGWSLKLKSSPRGFMFRPNLHEPGEIEVMGRTWPSGEQGGVDLLAWLGTHPASFQHVAEKLVRHFVADDPPPADVARIAAVLRDTRGDLGAASATLVELDGAWVPGAKLRTPQEFTIAALRAAQVPLDQLPNLLQIVGGLGQGVFQAPAPIGWPDRAADWSGPEAMLQRVDYAYGLAGRAPEIDPEPLAHAVLGPLLTADTLGQIRAAGSRRDGLTLLLACPEFQRR